MRPITLSLLVLCLFGALADADAQSYTHIAPHTVGGTAALTGTAFQSFVSIGLTAAGTVEDASRTRVAAFGPWPIYALMQRRDTGTPVESIDRPASYYLDQNYPNPFNPATAIRFSLPEPTHVRLTVYDALGRVVDVLVDERRAPGTYMVPFDATGLSTGVYVYRIQAGSFLQGRTMILLR